MSDRQKTCSSTEELSDYFRGADEALAAIFRIIDVTDLSGSQLMFLLPEIADRLSSSSNVTQAICDALVGTRSNCDLRESIRRYAMRQFLENNAPVMSAASFDQTLAEILAAKKEYFPNRPSIPPGLRKQVFERDAYRCQLCDSWEDLAIDHIHPESKGGPTSLENLQTLCRSCNSRKGDQI